MRQVFSSPRIENVEGVARLLEDAGIQVRISNGRSYRGAIRGNFSYRDGERSKRGPPPAVWVVRTDQHPRARQLLREAGLLATPRLPQDGFLPTTLHGRDTARLGDDAVAAPAARGRKAKRIKLALLVLIALAAGLVLRDMRQAPRPAATAPAAAAPESRIVPLASADPSAAYVVATPPALAETLLLVELEAQAPPLACIAIDGAAPPADLLGRLRAAGHRVDAAPACDTGTARVAMDVNGYRTDGSGTGTVRLDLHHRAAQGTGTGQSERRLLEVQRQGHRWRVLRLVP